MKKTTTLTLAALTALALTACGETEEQQPSTSSTSSTPSSSREDATTESSPTTTTSSEASSEEAATSEPPAPVAAEPSPAEAAPIPESEPYIVECLFGTPGPTLMSDGTTQYTDHCFYANGGPEYLEAENQAGLVDPNSIPYADGGTCPAYQCGYGHNSEGARNPSSGEIQTYNGCQEGYITDQELCSAVAWVGDHQY